VNPIVSFSLFGKDENDVYYRGALRNAQMYAAIRPDWHLRFYVSRAVPESVCDTLRDQSNTSVVMRADSDDQRSTYWRFLALRDAGYSHYLFRDVDSRPSERELDAVDEWIESGRQFHVMRDHPRHGVPMLAGMWGASSAGAARVRGILPDQLKTSYYQVDQDFLKYHIWPIAKTDVLAHVDFGHHFNDTETRQFRVPRKDFDYVAECHNGDDTLRFPEHRLEIAISGYRAEQG